MSNEGFAMYCSNCGEKIADSSNFCKHCGAKVGSGRDSSAGSAQPGSAQPGPEPVGDATPAPDVTKPMPAVAPQPTPDSAFVPNPPSSAKSAGGAVSPKVAAVIAAVVVCVAVGGFVAFYAATSGRQGSSEQQTTETQSETQSSSDAAAKATAEQKAAEEEAAEEAEKKAAEEKAAKEAEEQAKKEEEEKAAQEKATEAEHQQKIADAEAQGKVVFTGTIHIFETEADLAGYYGGDDQKMYNSNYAGSKFYTDQGPYIILELDSAQSVATKAADNTSVTWSGNRVALDYGKRARVVDLWRPYAGAHATVAINGCWTQTDTSLPAYALRADDASVLF